MYVPMSICASALAAETARAESRNARQRARRARVFKVTLVSLIVSSCVCCARALLALHLKGLDEAGDDARHQNLVAFLDDDEVERIGGARVVYPAEVARTVGVDGVTARVGSGDGRAEVAARVPAGEVARAVEVHDADGRGRLRRVADVRGPRPAEATRQRLIGG